MKRDMTDLNLCAAFRAEPESCHRALMDAARSVREERQTMRKSSFRTVIIAAIAALSMLTNLCVWISLALTIISLVDYIAKNHKVITEGSM